MKDNTKKIKEELRKKNILIDKSYCSYVSYVFNVRNKNRIVKVSSVGEWETFSGFSSKEEIFKTLSYFKKTKNKSVVKIHEFGSFNIDDCEYVYYVMDKLKPLNVKLKYQDMIDLVNVAESVAYREKVSNKVFQNKVCSFLTEVGKLKYKHYDLHSKNIMLDRYGNYKLIDLESFGKRGL